MGTQYKLINDFDLTFNDIITSDGEVQTKIVEKIVPNADIQARFIQNCQEMGILTTI